MVWLHCLVCFLGSIHLSRFMGEGKKIWNQAVQKRVGVTSSIFGSMKAVKLMGLTDSISEDIQFLRTKELDLSEKFRALIVWMNVLGMYRNKLCSFVWVNSYIYSKYSGNCFTWDHLRSLCGV